MVNVSFVTSILVVSNFLRFFLLTYLDCIISHIVCIARMYVSYHTPTTHQDSIVIVSLPFLHTR